MKLALSEMLAPENPITKLRSPYALMLESRLYNRRPTLLEILLDMLFRGCPEGRRLDPFILKICPISASNRYRPAETILTSYSQLNVSNGVMLSRAIVSSCES